MEAPGGNEPAALASIWEPQSCRDVDKFVSDRWEPLTHFADFGMFPAGLPTLYAELHAIVSSKKPGRERDDERIMAMNNGIVIEDMTMAKLAYDRACRRGLGSRLPFIASPVEVFQFWRGRGAGWMIRADSAGV